MRGRFQLRQHAGGDQQLIGFGIQLLGIGQHVAFEQLEQDQLDLDLHAQVTSGLQKELAEHRRAERVVMVIEILAQQHVEPRGQLIEGKTVALEYPTDHGLDRHAALHVIGTRCRILEYQRAGQCGLHDFVLNQRDKGLEELLKKAPFDVFALEAQVAHGFEKDVLFDIVARPVGHFKQGIVGVIEQFLQAVAQLLGGLVADLKQNHRQAGERRVIRLIGSGLVQRHYIPVVVHPSLLKR